MKFYCNKCQNFLAFNTPHDSLFLVFGVPNAKYLAFGTPDGHALKAFTTPKLLFHILKTLKNKKNKTQFIQNRRLQPNNKGPSLPICQKILGTLATRSEMSATHLNIFLPKLSHFKSSKSASESLKNGF